MNTPLLIAHRGASGYLPEHTLPAYALAILQGADYIEPDLVATRDGVLVARHENEISGTTNVAEHPQYAARRRTQFIDGVETSGWFTEDFTFAEIKTLRARERLPQLRTASARLDGKLEVPALSEVLQYLGYINSIRTQAGLRPVGICPEIKHPSHFASIGLAMEPLLLAALRGIPEETPVFIQSFEVGNLQQLRRQCSYPLIQLMAAEGGPWDRGGAAPLDYAAMSTPAGLARVAAYAQVVGVQKNMVLQEAAGGALQATPLVHDAHAAGLAVHVWTLRAENQFLPGTMQRGSEMSALGDLAAEVRAFAAAGVDGLFCDHPGPARIALQGIAESN